MADDAKVGIAIKRYMAGDDHGHYAWALCGACGEKVLDSARQCPECGATFVDATYQSYPFGCRE